MDINTPLTDLLEFFQNASDAEFEQWLANTQRQPISREEVVVAKKLAEGLGSLQKANQIFDRLGQVPEVQANPLSMALLFRGRANLYQAYEEFAQSLHAADQAITIYQRHGTDFDVAVASVIKVVVLGSQGHYEEAMALAHWIYPHFANRRFRLGLGHLAFARALTQTVAWRLKPALADYRRALRHFSALSGTRSQVALTLLNMGVVADSMDRLEDAQQWLSEALSMLDESDTVKSIKVSFALAHNCIRRGEYSDAFNYLNRAHDILAEKVPNSPDNGFVDLDRATIYLLLNQLEKAESYARDALERFELLDLPLDRTEALLILARILGRSTDLAKQQEAFQHFETAEQIFVTYEMTTAAALIQLEHAELLLRIVQPHDAIRTAQTALVAFEAEKLSLLQTQAHLIIGDACRAWSPAEAEYHYRRALKVNRGQSTLLTTRAWYGLGWLASVAETWRKAETYYKRALEGLEKLRRNLRSHIQQAHFFEDKRPLTTSLLGVVTSGTSHKQRDVTRLWSYIERNKAASLAELLLNHPPDTALDEPTKAALAEWEQLIKEFNQLQASQDHEEGGGLKFSLQRMRSQPLENPENKRKLAELRRRLQETDEKLAQLQAPSLAWRQGTTIDTKTIYRSLDSETLLVSYYTISTPTAWKNDTPEQLYALTATTGSNGIQIHPINLSLSKIETLWEQTFQAMERHYLNPTQEELNGLQRRLGRLYTLLIRPFAAQLIGKKRLLILPEREMAHIPFAALYDGEKRHYLVEQVILQIAPSATVLLGCQRIPSGALPPLLVGYAGKKGSDKYLPAVAPEIKTLENLIGKVTKLVGRNATLQNFWKESKGRSVIHFASHGNFDPNQPLEAEIELAEAYPLRAWELYQRFGYLSGSTVVISACKTAQGSVRGNDLLSLPSAFLYAGAVGVISGLWKVDDRATRRLMGEMYRSWGPNTDAARALQTAQLALLQNPQYATPYLWSPFVISGDSRCLPYKKLMNQEFDIL